MKLWFIFVMLLPLVVHAHKKRRFEGCVFDYNYYNYGEVLNEDHCFILTCVKRTFHKKGPPGIWVPSNSPRCPYCQVCNDPHIKTFDGKYYDFHGMCNYTLTQKIDSLLGGNFQTLNPEYGVYSEFKTCFGSSYASCVDDTVFKSDEHTIIEVNPSSYSGPLNYKINGANPCYYTSEATEVCNSDSYSHHAVITWEYNNCRRFQGKHLAVEFCNGCVRIYANHKDHDLHHHYHHYKPNHKHCGLNGLCGLFDNDVTNDFTRRNNVIVFGLTTFATSWKTANQSDDQCSSISNPRPCRFYHNYYKLCMYNLRQGILTDFEYKIAIRNCVLDMCATDGNEFLLKFNSGVVRQQIDIKDKTIIKKQGCVYHGKQYDVGHIILRWEVHYCLKCVMECEEPIWIKIQCGIKQDPFVIRETVERILPSQESYNDKHWH